MKKYSLLVRWGCFALVPFIVLSLMAHTYRPKQPTMAFNNMNDTVPDKKRNKVTRENGDRDLDKELRQLDKAEENLDKVKEKDWDKIEKDINESLRKIDLDKIKRQAEEAVKRVDVDKINREIEASLQRIDFDKMQAQINESMEEVSKIDKEAIKKELEEAKKQVKEAMEKQEWKEELKHAQKINSEKIAQEMEHAKREMEKAKDEMQHQKLHFRADMDKAKVEVGKAREELKGYQEMIYDMEKEGLLSSKGDYTIEYKNGELLINDKKQPKEVADKYQPYFKTKQVTIKKEDGDMKINQHRSDTHLD